MVAAFLAIGLSGVTDICPVEACPPPTPVEFGAESPPPVAKVTPKTSFTTPDWEASVTAFVFIDVRSCCIWLPPEGDGVVVPIDA